MADPHNYRFLRDPVKLLRALWPEDTLYDQQVAVVRSVMGNGVDDHGNDETYWAAGNMMGKDYGTGFILPAFFLTRHPVRMITTSPKEDHLRVVWGEMIDRINRSKVKLRVEDGGPLLITHNEIRKVVRGEICPLSYCRGMVASDQTEAALQGHHIAQTGDGIPRTLFFGDEASGLKASYKKMADSWANRILMIGNTWDCNNHFKWAFHGRKGTQDKGGDIPRANGRGYVRKVFRTGVEESPNIKYARAEIGAGKPPSGKIILPGVKPWDEFQKNLLIWDAQEQSVKLYARWYEGAELRLFPGEWIEFACKLADAIRTRRRVAKAIGIDPGEGDANTAWAAVDEYGLIDLESLKTPDTNEIIGRTISFGRRHGVDPWNWVFDRGGGGLQHADRLRSMKYKVRTVGFGEGVAVEPKASKVQVQERREVKEEAYAFKNRRAQLYGELRDLMNPRLVDLSFLKQNAPDLKNPDDQAKALRFTNGFAIPREYGRLIESMEPIPLKRDGEGRLVLPPKNRKDVTDEDEECLVDLIGFSPDELDAVTLAVHGMLHKSRIVQIGGMV